MMSLVKLFVLILSCAYPVKSFESYLVEEDSPPDMFQTLPSQLSLSRHFAVWFDNELGRGDEKLTEQKKAELDNNFIRMNEILHVFPEGMMGKVLAPPEPLLIEGKVKGKASTSAMKASTPKNPDPTPMKTNQLSSTEKPEPKVVTIPLKRVRPISPRFGNRNTNTYHL